MIIPDMSNIAGTVGLNVGTIKMLYAEISSKIPSELVHIVEMVIIVQLLVEGFKRVIMMAVGVSILLAVVGSSTPVSSCLF